MGKVLCDVESIFKVNGDLCAPFRFIEVLDRGTLNQVCYILWR